MYFYETSALNEYNIKNLFYNAINTIYNLTKENNQYQDIDKRHSNCNVQIDEVVNLSALNIQLVDNNGNNENNRHNHKSCCC